MLKQGDVGKIQGNGDVVCWQHDGWRSTDALMSRAAGWLEGKHTKQISLSSQETAHCNSLIPKILTMDSVRTKHRV